MMKKLTLSLLGIASAAALGGCGGGSGPIGPASTIADLNQNIQVASTIAPNGDMNPYGLAMPPANYTGVNAATGAKNVLQPGDLLISDFSNKAGANLGTTILRYTPSTGVVSPFYQEKIAKGPVALAISSLGTLWIANYQPGYTNSADGANTGDGNVTVITPNGTDFPNNAGIIDNNSGATFTPSTATFAGPWGQAFAVKQGTTTPYFFVTEVESGAIQRQAFVPGHFNAESVVTIGQLPVGQNAFDPTGPQGMAYDPSTDTLYVASTADNRIVAYPNATTTQTFEAPITVYQGMPLNAPLGLAINPINGDLLTVNQLDNNIVEIAPNLTQSSGGESFNARVVATRLLDNTPVNPANGTGSALFGLVATKDSNGNLVVYYTDSNTNSLNALK
jgi:hypothetical protein